jgi:hypothetical protein
MAKVPGWTKTIEFALVPDTPVFGDRLLLPGISAAERPIKQAKSPDIETLRYIVVMLRYVVLGPSCV